jgi:hypothetical protein
MSQLQVPLRRDTPTAFAAFVAPSGALLRSQKRGTVSLASCEDLVPPSGWSARGHDLELIENGEQQSSNGIARLRLLRQPASVRTRHTARSSAPLLKQDHTSLKSRPCIVGWPVVEIVGPA